MTPEELKAARLELGLSGTEMASALGLGAATRVSEYENGAQAPSASVLILYDIYLNSPRTLKRVLSERNET